MRPPVEELAALDNIALCDQKSEKCKSAARMTTIRFYFCVYVDKKCLIKYIYCELYKNKLKKRKIEHLFYFDIFLSPTEKVQDHKNFLSETIRIFFIVKNNFTICLV